jgi:phosphotransacetylase
MPKYDKELEKLIAANEGKKSEVSIGNIREIKRVIKNIAVATQEPICKKVHSDHGEVTVRFQSSLIHKWLNEEIAKVNKLRSKRQ